MAAARKEGLDTKPVKPSRPQGESPWSKVGVGNGAEGRRVAAGSAVVVNRR